MIDVHRSRDKRSILLLVAVLAASLVLTAASAWFLSRGDIKGAAISLAFAVLGLASVPIERAFRKSTGRRGFHASMQLNADAATVLRWSRGAIGDLGADLDINHGKQGTIWVDVPRGWRTWGERVTVMVRPRNGGVRVDVKSECLRSQWLDWGKNRSNVQMVLQVLESMGSGTAESQS